MNTLQTLIRLAKREVDDLTRVLADLETQRAAALARVVALDETVAAEQALAARHALAGAAYGGYARAVMDDRRALQADVARCEQEAAHVRALLEAAYVELKKVETLADWRAERRMIETNKRDAAALDETAIIRAARGG